VLHAFQKKSRKTARLDIELARLSSGGSFGIEGNNDGKLKYVRGSENIFVDLGFDKAEAENLKLRFELLMKLTTFTGEAV